MAMATDHLAGIQAIYQQLAQKKSNLILELVRDSSAPLEPFSHYPAGDVIDEETHSQYYYHSHATSQSEELPQHGHFHLFLRQAGIPKECLPTHKAKYPLCHLLGIAMDDFGYPSAFFTLNDWVTEGLWYPANVMLGLLELFAIEKKDSAHLTHAWVTHLVKLFSPYLAALFDRRDAVLADQKRLYPKNDPLKDKKLEILSLLPLTDTLSP